MAQSHLTENDFKMNAVACTLKLFAVVIYPKTL
jgi:hypothetical protein